MVIKAVITISAKPTKNVTRNKKLSLTMSMSFLCRVNEPLLLRLRTSNYVESPVHVVEGDDQRPLLVVERLRLPLEFPDQRSARAPQEVPDILRCVVVLKW